MKKASNIPVVSPNSNSVQIYFFLFFFVFLNESFRAPPQTEVSHVDDVWEAARARRCLASAVAWASD